MDNDHSTKRIGSNHNITRAQVSSRKVTIRLADNSEAIVKDVPSSALRRFSNIAKDNLTDKDCELVLNPIGLVAPTQKAFQWVANWLDFNMSENDPYPFYDAASQIRGDITFAVNVQAVLLTLDLSMGVLIRKLAGMIAEVIHSRAVRAGELEAIWNLLPRSYKLIDAAVESLVKGHKEAIIADHVWNEIQSFVEQDDELKTRFKKEELLQKHRKTSLRDEKWR